MKCLFLLLKSRESLFLNIGEFLSKISYHYRWEGRREGSDALYLCEVEMSFLKSRTMSYLAM